MIDRDTTRLKSDSVSTESPESRQNGTRSRGWHYLAAFAMCIGAALFFGRIVERALGSNHDPATIFLLTSAAAAGAGWLFAKVTLWVLKPTTEVRH